MTFAFSILFPPVPPVPDFPHPVIFFSSDASGDFTSSCCCGGAFFKTTRDFRSSLDEATSASLGFSFTCRRGKASAV